jgi:amide synthase
MNRDQDRASREKERDTLFNVDSYLRCLGFSGSATPTLETLRALHKRHLCAIPYDSSMNAQRGTSLWDQGNALAGLWNAEPAHLDAAFRTVALEGRGGVCYELCGLFRQLLLELGFDPVTFSAGVRQMDGGFGPDREHTFLCVDLDGARWLVDVGFAGPSFLEPLRLTGEVQVQYGCQYRITDQEGYLVLQRKPRDGDWQAIYRFTTQQRDFAEWHGPHPSLAALAGELVTIKTILRGRAFDTGQMVLIGKRYLRVEDGRETVRVLARKAEFEHMLNVILNLPSGDTNAQPTAVG